MPLDPAIDRALRACWVTCERFFDAPPARVHRAWTDPDEIAGWFPRYVEGSLAVGARSTFTWHDRRIPIDVLESEPGQLFRFRWPWKAQGVISEVTVKLWPRGYGTRLTLTDGPFDLTRSGGLEAYAEALEGWGEALSGLRAQVDFSVDLRRDMR